MSNVLWPQERVIGGDFGAIHRIRHNAETESLARTEKKGKVSRLVVVSNRVGVPDGSARAGGLEVAIRAALHKRGGIWFGWSGKVADEPEAPKTTKLDNISYVTVDLRSDDYEEFYNGFANRVLWPILHYRLDLAE